MEVLNLRTHFFSSEDDLQGGLFHKLLADYSLCCPQTFQHLHNHSPPFTYVGKGRRTRNDYVCIPIASRMLSASARQIELGTRRLLNSRLKGAVDRELGGECVRFVFPKFLIFDIFANKLCKSRHEPIGVRGFLRVLGRFFKMLGRRKRTQEKNGPRWKS